MRVKEWLAILICLLLPGFAAVLNSGCGNSPTASGSGPTPTYTPLVGGGSCVASYGFGDQAGVQLTPLAQNEYVALRFSAPATPDYPNYSAAASFGSAGIYAANSGTNPETIYLSAYGNESTHGGPLDGYGVSISVPVTTGGWQLVSMPNIGYTDMGPDVYLAAQALGPDLSIGAKGTNGGPAIAGVTVGLINGYLPTPTVTMVPAPNYEMFLKSCP
ncbi:MAG TPA: hypothetical protein VMU88_07965 [bacterium]|nr:hypothetical protein [bacterium]